MMLAAMMLGGWRLYEEVALISFSIYFLARRLELDGAHNAGIHAWCWSGDFKVIKDFAFSLSLNNGQKDLPLFRVKICTESAPWPFRQSAVNTTCVNIAVSIVLLQSGGSSQWWWCDDDVDNDDDDDKSALFKGLLSTERQKNDARGGLWWRWGCWGWRKRF